MIGRPVTEATRRVDDDRVVELALGLVEGRPRHLHGVATVLDPLGVAGLGREDGYAGALAVDLELLDGVRPLQVGSDQHRRLVLALQPERQLRGQGGLTGTLEAGQHDHRRRVLGVAQAAGLAAEDGDELLVDDLDDLLGGVQRLADLLAAGPLLDRSDELLDHRQRDVGLEQGDAHFAHRLVDISLRQRTAPGQLVEDAAESFLQLLEHVALSVL